MTLALAALLLATTDPDALGAFFPDFARLSSGGYAGLVTAGLGYAAWDDRLNVGLSYGYVPASIAGVAVHSLSSAISLRPFELRQDAFRWVPFYAGVGVLSTFGQRY